LGPYFPTKGTRWLAGWKNHAPTWDRGQVERWGTIESTKPKKKTPKQL